MVSSVGIVPVALHLLGWNWNVPSVFPALREDVAIDVLDFGRIAVRVIATTHRRMIRHVPGRIEFLVQRLILRRMMACGVALLVLRLDFRRKQAAETER